MHDRTTTVLDIWSYPQTSWGSIDLTGFGVEATDGSIGTVDEATHEAGASYLVVDTGPWIFGRKIMLPAGVISSVTPDDRKVFVNLTKDQIEHAPEFDESRFRDETYRDEVGTYYGANRPTGPDFGRGDNA